MEIKEPIKVGTEGVFLKLHGADRRITVFHWETEGRMRLWEAAVVGAIEWEIRLKAEGEGTEVTMSCEPTGGAKVLAPRSLDRAFGEMAERLKHRLEDPWGQAARFPFELGGFQIGRAHV